MRSRMPMKLPEYCKCGQKMHLSDSQRMLLQITAKKWGETKKVTILGGKSYYVPTYYIIVHGLKAKELPTLGFPEIPS